MKKVLTRFALFATRVLLTCPDWGLLFSTSRINQGQNNEKTKETIDQSANYSKRIYPAGIYRHLRDSIRAGGAKRQAKCGQNQRARLTTRKRGHKSFGRAVLEATDNSVSTEPGSVYAQRHAGYSASGRGHRANSHSHFSAGRTHGDVRRLSDLAGEHWHRAVRL